MRAFVGALGRGVVAAASRAWPPYSRLFLVSDFGSWVIAREMAEVGKVVRRLGIRTANPRLARHVRGQSVFHGSQFALLDGRPLPVGNRLGVAYFHGRPGTPGAPEFDRCWQTLRDSHHLVDRVQVTHSEMRDIVLSTGIDPAKVHTIPIGIDLRAFPLCDRAARVAARRRFGIPESAAVIGSFQKDGAGWGEGNEPKAIKGPDVLVQVAHRLREQVPELFVLLGGPARGYVKRGLEESGVPYAHVVPGDDFGLVPILFHALDLYVVGSRQEGGPKALFESWATGVPLVTTRVGQAMDLVEHGVNGWMVDVGDVEGLVEWSAYALGHPAEAADVARRARQAVEPHDYAAQAPLWRELMCGFVEVPG